MSVPNIEPYFEHVVYVTHFSVVKMCKCLCLLVKKKSFILPCFEGAG